MANWADRPDFSKEVLTKEDLEVLANRLRALSVPDVWDFYSAALSRCKLDADNQLPKAVCIQQFVTVWKVMRSWSKKR